MVKKVTAIKARQNLGQVMNEVLLTGDEYIVERAGRPMVAIISIDKYEILKKDRESATRALDKIWKKMKKERPGVIENTIQEAVRSVRHI
jgi:prevent-host-death family protein